MGLIERATEFEKDGGGRTAFEALIGECIKAADLDGLVATRILFQGQHESSGGDSGIKHKTAWTLLRWGPEGMRELVAATRANLSYKSVAACLSTLGILAGGTDRPHLVREVDHEQEAAIVGPLFDDIQMAARAALAELVLSIDDDFDVAQVAMNGFQTLSLHGDAATREWFAALAVRWLAVSTPVLDRYEQLIATDPTDERGFQKFLSANPQLLDPMAIEVWPLPALHGAKEPDFVIRRTDDSYLVVEIESPSKLLVTKANHISAQATQAVSQASDYRDFINRLPHPERYFPGIHDIDCLAIVGLEEPLSPAQKGALRNDNRHRHGLRLAGFDWLAKRARAIARNVTSNTIPVRHGRFA